MDVVFAFYAFCILFLSTSDCFAMPRNPVGTNNDDCHYRRWTKCEGLPKYITSIKPTVKKTDLLNQYIGSVYQKLTEILKKGIHERSEEDHNLLKKYKQVMQNKSG
ncbi:uncharacterized protein LOC130654983 [Hydractinia symbiolongicarpus]|uniref:uncharacterized protein LOC130654983 n=1 Tax=Hydractinia symbiolongicarpus TaxID=13093 RepID=UPI00254D494F|nr:uncharacterized protein LOC130654983 [Hydractinia symbiolongicarpus]